MASIMKVVTDMDDFNAQLDGAGDRLLMIDFFAEWCLKCKSIVPQMEKLANTYADQLCVIQVDVEKFEDLLATYNIQSMPTFVFIRNKEQVETFLGADAEKMERTVKRLLGVDESNEL